MSRQAVASKLQRLQREREAEERAIVHEAETEKEVEELLRDEYNRAESTPKSPGVISFASEDLPAPSPGGITNASDGKPLSPGAVSDDKFTNGAHEGKCEPTARTPPSYLRGTSVQGDSRERMIKSMYQAYFSRSEIRRSYLLLFGFLLHFAVFISILSMQSHPVQEFKLLEGIREVFLPKTENDDDLRVAGDVSAIWAWLDGLVEVIWTDPVCGDSLCEHPQEFPSFAYYGCRADCGTKESTNVTITILAYTYCSGDCEEYEDAAVASKLQRLQREREAEERAIVHEAETEKEVEELLRDEYNRAESTPKSPGVISFASEDLPAPSPGGITNASDGKPLSPGAVSDDKFTNGAHEGKCEPTARTPPSYLRGTSVQGDSRERMIKSMYQAYFSRSEIRRSYLLLFGFLLNFAVFISILSMQSHPVQEFKLLEGIREVFLPKTENDDDLRVAGDVSAIWAWLDGLVEVIWTDPVCGDSLCEHPQEFPSFAYYGCRADCGTKESTNVTITILAYTYCSGDCEEYEDAGLFWNILLRQESEELYWFEEWQRPGFYRAHPEGKVAHAREAATRRKRLLQDNGNGEADAGGDGDYAGSRDDTGGGAEEDGTGGGEGSGDGDYVEAGPTPAVGRREDFIQAEGEGSAMGTMLEAGRTGGAEEDYTGGGRALADLGLCWKQGRHRRWVGREDYTGGGEGSGVWGLCWKRDYNRRWGGRRWQQAEGGLWRGGLGAGSGGRHRRVGRRKMAQAEGRALAMGTMLEAGTTPAVGRKKMAQAEGRAQDGDYVGSRTTPACGSGGRLQRRGGLWRMGNMLEAGTSTGGWGGRRWQAEGRALMMGEYAGSGDDTGGGAVEDDTDGGDDTGGGAEEDDTDGGDANHDDGNSAAPEDDDSESVLYPELEEKDYCTSGYATPPPPDPCSLDNDWDSYDWASDDEDWRRKLTYFHGDGDTYEDDSYEEHSNDCGYTAECYFPDDCVGYSNWTKWLQELSTADAATVGSVDVCIQLADELYNNYPDHWEECHVDAEDDDARDEATLSACCTRYQGLLENNCWCTLLSYDRGFYWSQSYNPADDDRLAATMAVMAFANGAGDRYDMFACQALGYPQLLLPTDPCSRGEDGAVCLSDYLNSSDFICRYTDILSNATARVSVGDCPVAPVVAEASASVNPIACRHEFAWLFQINGNRSEYLQKCVSGDGNEYRESSNEEYKQWCCDAILPAIEYNCVCFERMQRGYPETDDNDFLEDLEESIVACGQTLPVCEDLEPALYYPGTYTHHDSLIEDSGQKPGSGASIAEPARMGPDAGGQSVNLGSER
ncbi:hypothetical protein CYMTET_20302 [Cymbomonas tetramitiformis]|uniref:Transmembrane protein n=1 Tax=Cymbomonas tetramitiformis TaxID=36881 RepID=A0AAE0G5P1_9CHLO|nr:hypothetical protein CYMTET_20302 [Cymbomonas tetramitiformis]